MNKSAMYKKPSKHKISSAVFAYISIISHHFDSELPEPKETTWMLALCERRKIDLSTKWKKILYKNVNKKLIFYQHICIRKPEAYYLCNVG